MYNFVPSVESLGPIGSLGPFPWIWSFQSGLAWVPLVPWFSFLFRNAPFLFFARNWSSSSRECQLRWTSRKLPFLVCKTPFRSLPSPAPPTPPSSFLRNPFQVKFFSRLFPPNFLLCTFFLICTFSCHVSSFYPPTGTFILFWICQIFVPFFTLPYLIR